MTAFLAALDRGVLGRIGLSLAGLILVASAVVGAFGAAFYLTGDAHPTALEPQRAADNTQGMPDIVGKVAVLRGDTLVVDTVAGRRTLLMSGSTAVLLQNGKVGTRQDLKNGLRVAIFGGLVDLQTFRVDLVVVLPPG